MQRLHNLHAHTQTHAPVCTYVKEGVKDDKQKCEKKRKTSRRKTLLQRHTHTYNAHAQTKKKCKTDTRWKSIGIEKLLRRIRDCPIKMCSLDENNCRGRRRTVERAAAAAHTHTHTCKQTTKRVRSNRQSKSQRQQQRLAKNNNKNFANSAAADDGGVQRDWTRHVPRQASASAPKWGPIVKSNNNNNSNTVGAK